MAKQKKVTEFLDSDDKWRREQINKINQVILDVRNYEWMPPSQKEEIVETLKKSQNKFIIQKLF